MTKPLIQFTDDMIGRMFRVTGKRGRAKHFAGKVGRLVWVGPFED